MAVAISSLFLYSRLYPPNSPDLSKAIIQIGDHRLQVDLAVTPRDQIRGLSGRKNIEDTEGMLFILPTEMVPGFWMKKMNFPIDIIWISADKKIISITKDLKPETYPNSFYPPQPVLYVLEVKSGWADNNQIREGAIVEIDK